MLEIRFSKPKELEVSGTVDELQSVRNQILALVENDIAQIAFECDGSINSMPYDSVLSKFIVRKSQLPTKVSLENSNELCVEGLPHCLEAFASFLDFEANSKSGRHSHYEYYEGNQWISPDSMPLVISVK